ncbi:two-component system response regulator YesN [Evansella vedderi]|uniref:Two-component system response regulator YesN n=1 Tax=Evansella vedderi TaxID=38282 RepID=A0ABT9ZSP3_9BACI|nr:response regulator transcription factor [Evansella vedderi]MDQ0253195.1 two-component system response regulator YesN [Evansella vedderi]
MWQVVIIDDEDKVLRGMKNAIPWDDLNCEWVGEALNGEEGLQLVQEQNPDIVITDIYMPVMNGLEMIEKLKNNGFDGKVIILSGYEDFEYARRAMRLQIDDYLSKPASLDTIKTTLTNVVKKLEDETNEKLKYAELIDKVKLYEPFIIKEWIKSLLMGTPSLSRLPNASKSIIEKWEGKKHVVLSILYDHSIESSALYQSDWYLFRFSTSNVIKEMTKKYFEDFNYVELHSYLGTLCIHFDELDDEKTYNKLQELCNSIQSSIQTYLGVKAIVNIGKIKENWTEMADSMKEAIQSNVNDDNNVNCSIFGLDNTKTLSSESIETSRKLSEAIRYADNQTACDEIDKLFSIVSGHEYNNAIGVKVGIEIWTVMTYSLYDIGIRIQDMVPENFDLYKELLTIYSWEELAEFLKGHIKEFCHHQQWDENLKHRQLVEQLIDYVQENLGENVTLQDIANKLYISRNYLGRIFKDVTGESFKNYITRVRVEKAKKMIQEGNHLIYEVAEKVGFGNPAYFTTTFKKYTGYPPTNLINKSLNTTNK